MLRGNRQTTPIAREVRVGIGLRQIRCMLAGNAVEELLETRRAQETAEGSRLGIAGLHLLQARLVLEQRGEHVGAQREPAVVRERLVHVIPNEITARMRHERHIADARDTLLGHTSHLIGVRLLDALV